MPFRRKIVRGSSVLLAGVIAVSALAGCARTNDNVEDLFAEDPAVTAVEVLDNGPARYEITVDDALSGTELSEAAVRLSEISAKEKNTQVVFLARSGDWQWYLSRDEDAAVSIAETISELSEVDGVYRGTVSPGTDGLYVEAVTAAGADPAALVAPLAAAVESGPVEDAVTFVVTDLHDRLSVETQDPAGLRPAIEAVAAIGEEGTIQSYSLTDTKLAMRMRTADGAAAAAPVAEALAAGETGVRAEVTSGIMTTSGLVSTTSAEFDAQISAVLTPISGVVGMEVETRSAEIDVLIVTTVDAETALSVQQILLAEPALQHYRSLQFTVQQEDIPGDRIKALSPIESGFVGTLEPAIGLADDEGVVSVVLTPNTLNIVLANDADVVSLVPAIKSLALRGQDAQIFESSSGGSTPEYPGYAFSVTGKLNTKLVDGSGSDKDAFVEAWNDAPGL